jgi:putative NIF3 family GTP cyclohydrolase 1 type 2
MTEAAPNSAAATRDGTGYVCEAPTREVEKNLAAVALRRSAIALGLTLGD